MSPSSHLVVGSVARGTASDVDAAVAAARRAFESWSREQPSVRADLLAEIARGVVQREEELAISITSEMGAPISSARTTHLASARFVFGYYGDLALKYDWITREENLLLERVPVGVVAAITPWNFPVHQLSVKVAAAVAAGCTVVAKPSQVAPMSSLILADIFHRAGAPAGVFNVVTGTGPEVGELLAGHPDVAMVSFTGSTEAGQRTATVAAGGVKRTSLELGGKSANIILDGSQFEARVEIGVRQMMGNAGQACSAWTRMLVPRPLYDRAGSHAAAIANALRIGDPWDPDTEVGPLASDRQAARVRAMVSEAVEAGAEVFTQPSPRDAEEDSGPWVRPVVVGDPECSLRLSREEVFGPVLVVIPFEDEDDAIRLANDSPYGLVAAVWSSDLKQAERVAAQLRVGRVLINQSRAGLATPFGGFKASGYGREMGLAGMEEFLAIRAVVT